MKEYFNILLATDYSETSMNAELYAIQFAKDSKSYLTQLHVYKKPSLASLTEEDVAKQLNAVKKTELKKLKDHRNKILKALHTNIHELYFRSVVKEGNIAKAILQEAKYIEADFIIIGTHGANTFREKFFGSHVWDILKNATVPLILIPQDSLYRRIKKIIFVTEFREGELPIIQYLSHLSNQLEAELTILHIANNSISNEFEKHLTTDFLNEVKSQTNNDSLNIQVIKKDNIVEGINNYCINNEIDWLIMSPEQKFLFEKIFNPGSSTVKKMAFQTLLPLVTIPDYYNPSFAKYLDIIDVNTYMSELY